jgi:DNA invertase Pin-like site-specific DNA recombinase
MGKAVFTIIAAIAELERSVIRERVLSGMDYARRHGTRSGKPIGRSKAIFDRDMVVSMRGDGNSWRTIARKLDVGITTVRRVYSESVDAAHRLQSAKTEVA